MSSAKNIEKVIGKTKFVLNIFKGGWFFIALLQRDSGEFFLKTKINSVLFVNVEMGSKFTGCLFK